LCQELVAGPADPLDCRCRANRLIAALFLRLTKTSRWNSGTSPPMEHWIRVNAATRIF
jgi:hypothetical protein